MAIGGGMVLLGVLMAMTPNTHGDTVMGILIATAGALIFFAAKRA